MKRSNYKKALRKLAKKHGLPVDEISRDIDIAIKEAQAHPDIAVQSRWADIPSKDPMPTSEETMKYLAKKFSKYYKS